MATLCAPADIQVIITTDVPDIQPFINMADLIVNENLSNLGYSTARLTEIERWLAAHFIAVSMDRQVISESAGDGVSQRFAEASGSNFRETSYGRNAIALDTCGVLESIAAKGKIYVPNINMF